MSFANPQAFLLLLTIPIILLFHLFRVKRRAVHVATLRFWDAPAPQREASSPSWRRLHRNLLLLLQILAVVCVTLALARPTLTVAAQGWPRTVLIIDTSASMQATDVSGSRFAAARDTALTILGTLKPGQQAMLIEASSPPEALVPFTENTQILKDALQVLRPRDGPGGLNEAIQIASQLVQNGPPADIQLFTDAAFPSLSSPQPQIPRLKWHTVGQPTANVGITALTIRKSLSGEFDYQVYLVLSNFGMESKSTLFRLLLNGSLIYEQRFDIASGTDRSLVIPFTHQTGGVLRAEFDLNDGLALDNVAYAILPEPRSLRVLLVTRGNLFLEEALRADSRVQLQIVAPTEFRIGTSDADVVVLDGLSPATLPPGRYLLIRSLAGNAPLRQVGSIELPTVVDWDRDHPVMRYLDFSKLVIRQALRVHPLGNGEALAESHQTPLIYAWDEGGIRAVFVGFDLFQSDLRVRTAFPLFIANSLRWLYPTRLADAQLQFRVGAPIAADVGGNIQNATVVTPDGRSETISLTDARLTYDDTRSIGVYTVQANGKQYRYAVNLLDREESNLTPGRGVPDQPGRKQAEPPIFQAPQELWRLFAALALVVIVAEPLLYLYRQGRLFSRSALLLRLPVVLLAGLALLRLQLPIPDDAVHVVFLLDTSDSIPSRQQAQALNQVHAALRRQAKNDTARLVTFATTAELAAEFEQGTVAPPPVEGQATDIAQALRLALSSLPREGTRRILLMSDGNENRQSSMDAAREAKRQKIAIYAYPLGGPDTEEALVERIVLPQQVEQGEPFDISIVARSTEAREGRLLLYRNGVLASEQAVLLQAGKNVFSYKESQEMQGFTSYEAFLEVQRDNIKENNRALGVVAIRDRPQILYIEKDQAQGRYLLEALKTQYINANQVGPGGIDAALNRISDYDALILSNTSALRLDNSQMEAIRDYVSEQGGGLIMLGGEESFGLGGYYRTPIEEALPVTMNARQKIDVPSMTVVLVIDRSGSMNTEQGRFTRMDLAKEAAQLAVELLGERTEVGVIAFDTAWNWAVPIAPAKDKEGVLREIAAIDAGGGGTELFWALEEAHRAVSQQATMLKHIIIMSDGEVPSAGFAELLEQINHDKITVSTVAISSEAGVELLRDISRRGHGRFYFTGDVYKIPRIFTMETQLANKAGLVEQPFRPEVRHHHEILKGIDWNTVPPLGGYVPTTLKETAELLLFSPHQDPILAVWRYGLGRSAAFTSEVKPRWGTHWLQWHEFNRLFAQLIRWTLGNSRHGEIASSLQIDEDRGEVLIEAVDAEGTFINFLEGEVGVVFPNQSRRVLPLVQSGPGRYRMSFATNGQGNYLMGITLRQGSNTLATDIGSGVLSYPVEHRVLSINERLLETLAQRTGGQVLTDPADIFRHNRSESSRTVDIWPWLLLSALLLMLIDVALRWLRGMKRADNRWDNT